MSDSVISPRAAGVAALVLLVAIVVFMAVLVEHLPVAVWRENLRNSGSMGALLFVLVGMLATSIGFPRQLVAGVGGYAYGLAPGLLLSLVAAIGGCALTVVAARWLLAGPVSRHFSQQVNWLRRMTQQDTFMKIVVMRIQPLGTNLATNLAAGVIRLPLPVFLAASILGFIPQMLVFAIAGSGIAVGSGTEIAVAAGLFVVSLILAAVLWRRHQAASQGRE